LEIKLNFNLFIYLTFFKVNAVDSVESGVLEKGATVFWHARLGTIGRQFQLLTDLWQNGGINGII
jgi:hypothetical protein